MHFFRLLDAAGLDHAQPCDDSRPQNHDAQDLFDSH
jgi:hypothetical protein